MATSLPPLDSTTRLSPRIIRVLGANPGKFTLQGSNTYLIGTGSERILLDTGEGKAEWRETLEAVLAEQGARVTDVVLTHWHGDHVGGVNDVLALSGEGGKPRVWKHRGGELVDVEGAGQWTGTVGDYAEGKVFSVEGATMRAVHCPGHTVDHMAFVLEEEDAMFTGDNVLGHGTAVFEDLATYLASLERMMGLFRGRAYPGHGEVVQDGVAKIREYIEHRRQREIEAVQTLRGKEGGMGSMEMVRVIYSQYPEHLHGPAEWSLSHVLRKLEGEGKAKQDDDGKWTLTEKATL